MLLIKIDDLSHPAVTDLLREHLEEMHQLSPRESVHALDADALKASDITFWTAWQQEALLGCAALRELSADHGEVKSMRTARAHQRKGIAATMLEHVLAEARGRGYSRVSLETGSQPGFEPARQLYLRYGFVQCGPLEGYKPDPNSFFMTLVL